MGDEAEEQVEVETEEEHQLWIREVGAPRPSRCAIKITHSLDEDDAKCLQGDVTLACLS